LYQLEAEAARQPKVLQTFSRSKFSRAPPGTVFVGAGDSYAAALAGFYASRGKCIALDPYALASEPGTAAGAEVVFISVSGRTSGNVRAASRVRGLASKITVLTAVEGSALAKSADEVVVLPMDYLPKWPGILSFSLSALAVLKMVGASDPCDFRRAFTWAKADCKKLALARGTTYLLGNWLGHAAALYVAAKAYEVLGARSHAEALEEFSHMELFSLGAADSVGIFADFDPDRVGARLSEALTKEGYSSTLVPARGGSQTEKFYHSVFTGQLCVLAEAQRSGIDKPRFLTAKRRLRVSDSMIY
jgi:hypothetical protein